MTIQGHSSLLLIEPEPSCAQAICKTLDHHYGHASVHAVTSLSQALAYGLEHINMVLTSLHLEDASGMAVLDQLLDHRPDLPVVIITGLSDFELAMAAIQRGACDYLVKAGDYQFALPILVEKNLAIHRTRQENLRLHQELTRTLDELRHKNMQLEDAVKQLQTIAATDPLTGLANRRAIDLAMEQTFTQCHRYGRDLACIMTDIDGFKQYNDALGHQAGDQLLIQLARVLEANCRRSDVAGRFGGDEFIVLLPETDSSTARLVAKRIAEQFELGWETLRARGGPPVRCSLSMGLACLRLAGAVSVEQLLQQADQALYHAKTSGKARLCVFNATTQPTHDIRPATALEDRVLAAKA